MRTKNDDKIETILKAALKIVKDKGIVGLSMSALAKKSGLATGTLYIYFKDKESLLETLYKKLKKEKTSQILLGFQENGEFKSTIKLLWLNDLKSRINFPDESNFIDQYNTLILCGDDYEVAREFKKILFSHFDKGKKIGLIKNLENELILVLMIGAIKSVAQYMISEKIPLQGQYVEEAFNFCWDGIKSS